jgi:phosphoglycolate phosphatase
VTVIGFDLDMTLVDSADAIVDSIAHTCRVYGVEIDEQAVRDGVGLPLDRVFPDYIPDVPYDEALEI